jgi:hypothetical protein
MQSEALMPILLRIARLATGVWMGMIAVLISCSDYRQPEVRFNRNPVLPPVEMLQVVSGLGTRQIQVGMPRDSAEMFLGAPVSSGAGFLYKKDDVQYRLYYLGNMVSGVEVSCTRFSTVIIFSRAAFIDGPGYDGTRAQLVSIFGEAPREAGTEWYYDSYGIGYIFDQQTKRITSVHVFMPVGQTQPKYSVRKAHISNGIDQDGDGYLRKFSLVWDVGISRGSDSTFVSFYFKEQSETTWTSLGTLKNKIFASASLLADSHSVSFSGTGYRVSNYRIVILNSDTEFVADTTLYGIKEESQANDSIVPVPMLYVSRGLMNFGSTVTSDTFAISNTGKGTLSWTISDNASWLSVSPTSGTTTTEKDVITATVNRSGLTSGTNSATITITGGGITRTISVTAIGQTAANYSYTFRNKTDADMVCYMSGVLIDTILARDSITVVRSVSTNTQIPLYFRTLVITDNYLTWLDTMWSAENYKHGYYVDSSYFLLRLTNNTNKTMTGVKVTSTTPYGRDSAGVYLPVGTTRNIGFYRASASTYIATYHLLATEYIYWSSVNTRNSIDEAKLVHMKPSLTLE